MLETALPHLCGKAGVSRVVLESRNTQSQGSETHDASDHRVLQRLLQRGDVPPSTKLQHQGKEQVLIAIADLIAGARTDWLCAVAEEPFALVTHRVTAIVAVTVG